MKPKQKVINPRTEELNREFENEINKEIVKNSQTEAIKEYLNFRDNMKPSYGVAF